MNYLLYPFLSYLHYIQTLFLFFENSVIYFCVSNGRVEFKTAFDGKDQQSYNTNWISTGVNVALAVVQFGVEYRYSQKTEIEFEYNGDKTKRDIASNSQSIYFGFGLGF